MSDYLDHAQDRNYNDFKDSIADIVKAKLREHPRIQDYAEKMNSLTQKINKLKEIQEL